MKKSLILVAAILLGSFAAIPAWAFLKSEDIPKLDRKVLMERDAFREQSEEIIDVPNEDQALAFKVRLPKGWIKLPAPKTENVMLSAELFTDLATYLSPPKGDTRSRFRVRALELKHLVSAENWFLNYVLSVGSTIDGLLTKSDRRLEAEYTVLDSGQSYLVRAAAEITGSRMVLAEYMVPSEYAKDERDQQIWSMISFALTTPDQTPVEAVDTYTFVDIVKFEYPQSWILFSPPIITIDRMDAAIINLKGLSKDEAKNIDLDNLKLDGRIDVKVISKTLGTNEAEEIELLKSELKEKGLEIGSLIKPVKDLKLHEGIIKSQIDSYLIKSEDLKMARYELWVALLETKGRYYVITLITVGREESFYVWAQNIETFKFVVKTLSPVNDNN